MEIRAAVPDDLDALYDICLRTGAAGEDATDDFTDPKLLGHVYAAPYLLHEPDHAFVLDDGTRAIGYVLGALDSRSFEARLEAEWWPALRDQYPKGAPGRTHDDENTVRIIHRPPVAFDGILGDYPSHLHIDLLPQAHRQGWGTRMLETLYESLGAAGSVGVHLGVSAKNERGVAFYRAVGFEHLAGNEFGHLFGRRFT